jgi:hypothetical protein
MRGFLVFPIIPLTKNGGCPYLFPEINLAVVVDKENILPIVSSLRPWHTMMITVAADKSIKWWLSLVFSKEFNYDCGFL